MLLVSVFVVSDEAFEGAYADWLVYFALGTHVLTWTETDSTTD